VRIKELFSQVGFLIFVFTEQPIDGITIHPIDSADILTPVL
jgi:hypothetical protein